MDRRAILVPQGTTVCGNRKGKSVYNREQGVWGARSAGHASQNLSGLRKSER